MLCALRLFNAPISKLLFKFVIFMVKIDFYGQFYGHSAFSKKAEFGQFLESESVFMLGFDVRRVVLCAEFISDKRNHFPISAQKVIVKSRLL